MHTVADIIRRASMTLRDQEKGHEYTTWSKQTLLEYLQEGICELAGLRPDLFTETRTIPLKPGSTQSLPADVIAVVDVTGNVETTASGVEKVTENVRQADQDLLRRFGKKRCTTSDSGTQDDCAQPGENYSVKNFVRSAHSNREFRVEPPVPEGARVEVTATVRRAPEELSLASLDKKTELKCGHHAQLVDWILHRAYEQEIESEYALRAKEYHMRKFYHGIGVDYFADSRAHSGYQLGLKGHGDRASGPQRDLRSPNYR